MQDVVATKQALREQVLERRRRMRPADLQLTAAGLRDVLLEVPEVARAAVITLYVSVGTEPGTGLLLDELYSRGLRILLPVVTNELDLDWAVYAGPDELASARMGLLEPTGPRLGPEAVGTADTVLLPGLTVDRTGMRLGRGAACYDRVLTRVAPNAFTCVLLHDQEPLKGPTPSEEHDRPVQAAATPSGLLRFE